jgi:hypothetical protein
VTHYTFDGVASYTTRPVSQFAPTNILGSCTLEAVGLPVDFDYTILGALFAFTFSVVVGLYLFGRSAGAIVNIFKPR